MIDDEIMATAMKKAGEVGLLPKSAFVTDVAKHWEGLEAVVAAAMEIEHGARLRAESERDALIEACLDHGTYTVPDDFEPGEPHTVVEYWANRLAGEMDDCYTSREAAVRAIRKSAGLDDTEERTTQP